MNKLNENPDLPAVDPELFNDKLCLFGDLQTQQAFVQEFFDSAKNINKDIRSRLLLRKRLDAKALKLASKISLNPKPSKINKSKGKKKVISNDPFVNLIVGEPTVPL